MTRQKLWLGFTGTQREGEFFLLNSISIVNQHANNALLLGSCSRTLTFDLTKYRES